MVDFSIASYSFHRALASGQQDMFKYIEDSKALGMAQLDPWNGHLSPVTDEDTIIKAGQDPERAAFAAQHDDYVIRVKAAADAAGLPFGCLAVDGAHIYEDDPAKRLTNRHSAYRWLEVAHKLGAAQLRIDAGGPADMPDDVFAIILEGYHDLIARAGEKGIEILMENHWGPSRIPENVVKILDAVPQVGLLMDSNNWEKGMQERGWELCGKYTRSVHVKTFGFDEAGNDPSVDIARFIRLMVDAGYDGCWGIESVPRDGDEYGAITKTKTLIGRILGEIS